MKEVFILFLQLFRIPSYRCTTIYLTNLFLMGIYVVSNRIFCKKRKLHIAFLSLSLFLFFWIQVQRVELFTSTVPGTVWLHCVGKPLVYLYSFPSVPLPHSKPPPPLTGKHSIKCNVCDLHAFLQNVHCTCVHVLHLNILLRYNLTYKNPTLFSVQFHKFWQTYTVM